MEILKRKKFYLDKQDEVITRKEDLYYHRVKCSYCGTKLLVNIDDKEPDTHVYDSYTQHWFTCPVCKQTFIGWFTIFNRDKRYIEEPVDDSN